MIKFDPKVVADWAGDGGGSGLSSGVAGSGGVRLLKCGGT